LDAYEEQFVVIGQATTKINDDRYFTDERTSVRVHGEPSIAATDEINYLEVSPKQIISVTTSLIPFLEHDDANRALMGSNMQRQAVSCIKPEAPIVGTGVEGKAAYDSGQVLIAEADGIVQSVTSERVVVSKKMARKKNIRF
jgi:DNA-directed RNA polymerase subunit beta